MATELERLMALQNKKQNTQKSELQRLLEKKGYEFDNNGDIVVDLTTETNNGKKKFGKVTYDAYKAVKGNTLDSYKPKNEEEKKILDRYKQLSTDVPTTKNNSKEKVYSYNPTYGTDKYEYSKLRESDGSLPEFGSYEYFVSREKQLGELVGDIIKDEERKYKGYHDKANNYANGKLSVGDAEYEEGKRLYNKFSTQEEIVEDYKKVSEILDSFEGNGVKLKTDGDVDYETGKQTASNKKKRSDRIANAINPLEKTMEIVDSGQWDKKDIENQTVVLEHDAKSDIENEKIKAYNYYGKHHDNKYDGGFFGRTAGNYRVGDINERIGKSGFISFNYMSDDIEAAEVYGYLRDKLTKENQKAFTNYNGFDKTVAIVANYIPQFVNQTLAQIPGYLIVAAVGYSTGIGAKNGAQIGGAAGSAIYMYKQTAGQKYVDFIKENISPEEAQILAANTAVATGAVEFGLELALSKLFSGARTLASFKKTDGMVKELTATGMSKDAAKKVVAERVEKETVEKVAKRVANIGLSETTAKKVVNLSIQAGKYALNSFGEGAEEWIQTGMEFTADRYARAGKSASVFDIFTESLDLSKYTKEEFNQMDESFLSGMLLGFVSGGFKSATFKTIDKLVSVVGDNAVGIKIKQIDDGGHTITKLIEAGLQSEDKSIRNLAEEIKKSVRYNEEKVSNSKIGKLFKKVTKESRNVLPSFEELVNNETANIKQTATPESVTAVENTSNENVPETNVTGITPTENKAFDDYESEADELMNTDMSEDETVVDETPAEMVAEAKNKPTTEETVSVDETTKPQTKMPGVKVGDVYTSNGETFTITDRDNTHTTYTVTNENGNVIRKERAENTTADMNFAKKARLYTGVEVGDTYRNNESGVTYTVVSRDSNETTLKNNQNGKTKIMSNETADSLFAYDDAYTKVTDGNIATPTDASVETNDVHEATDNKGAKSSVNNANEDFINRFNKAINDGSVDSLGLKKVDLSTTGGMIEITDKQSGKFYVRNIGNDTFELYPDKDVSNRAYEPLFKPWYDIQRNNGNVISVTKPLLIKDNKFSGRYDLLSKGEVVISTSITEVKSNDNLVTNTQPATNEETASNDVENETKAEVLQNQPESDTIKSNENKVSESVGENNGIEQSGTTLENDERHSKVQVEGRIETVQDRSADGLHRETDGRNDTRRNRHISKGTSKSETRSLEEIVENDDFNELSLTVGNSITKNKYEELKTKYENDERLEIYDFSEVVAYDMLANPDNVLRELFADNISEYFNDDTDTTKDITGQSVPANVLNETKKSVVKNKLGQLIPVYHGTGSRFKHFNRSDVGIHFGNYAQAVKRVTDKKINNPHFIKAYLNIENPIIINQDFFGWNASQIVQKLSEMGIISQEEGLKFTKQNLENRQDMNDELADLLKNKKYDGIIYKNQFESGYANSYIVFDDSQIIRIEKETAENVHERVLDGESGNDSTVRKSEPIQKAEEERNIGTEDRELGEDVASENGTDIQATERKTPATGQHDSGDNDNGVRESDNSDGDSGIGVSGNDNVNDEVTDDSKPEKESKAKDYSITKAVAEELDTKAPSIDDNIKAIETLHELENSGKTPTKAQQSILAKFKGWGGLSNAFWQARSRLKEIMSDSEISAAQSTVNDAYFTPTSIIDSIYKGLSHLGFEGGNILEPSMGVGNFFGKMPKAIKDVSSLFGVEIDTISGKIAQYLYPSANIEVAPFQDVAYKDNSFDLIIGNVPFGEVKYKYKNNRYLIHDYFFVKAMDKLNDGGIMVFLTSKGTLDKLDSTTRAELNRQGNIIGAYRLPSNVFSRSANANVVTDLIIMQKTTNKNGEKFVNTGSIKIGNEDFSINEYFVNHPENIIGELTYRRGQYGKYELTVQATGDVSEQLTKAIKKLPKNLLSGVQTVGTTSVMDNTSKLQTFYVNDNGNVEYVDSQTGEVKVLKNTVKNKNNDIAKDYLAIKKAYTDLTDYTLNDVETDTVESKRKELNSLYDDFVKKHGTFEKNKKLLSADNDFYKLSGLEVYDTKTKKIIKSEMFTKDTIGKRKPKKADNALDALSISMGESGTVNLKRISELTNLPIKEVVEQLSDRIIYTPDGTYELNEVYLSGNVREKYEAVKGKKGFEKNEQMLKSVLPEDISAKDITPQLGSPWIEPKYIEDFLRETLHIYGTPKVSYDKTSGTWSISGNTWGDNTLMRNKYGTKYIDAVHLTLLMQSLFCLKLLCTRKPKDSTGF